VLWEFSSE
jgi:hypothetical protein